MIKKIAYSLCFFASLALPCSVFAVNSGPVLARNILGGAGSGAVVGLSAGALAYGLDNNYNPEVLLTSVAYGFLGGAIVGAGVGFYQISSNHYDSDFSLSGYVAGGTGIGSLIGGVVSVIPFVRDHHSEDFTVGIGLGGVVGAVLGLGVAALDLNSRPVAETKLLSGTLTIQPETGALASLIPDKQSGQPVLTCRLVKVTF
jgi:hypothetical protein